MEQTKQLDRASCHSGRANKQGVAYNANHNTMEQARSKQPHIDPARMHLNRYLQFFEGKPSVVHHGGKGGFNSRGHEMQRFKELYGKGLEARNERYKASGHKDRCKTMAQTYRDPKTCPTEIIFQVGSSKSEIDKDTRANVLIEAWKATIKIFLSKYRANFKPLDCAVHRDEREDHIHFRFTMGAKDKFGHFVPNQNAALEAMGFKPDPSKAKGRYNNPLIAFTDELRETFYTECDRMGIEIIREPSSASRRQLELIERKCEGFKQELEQLEAEKQQAIEEAQQAIAAARKAIAEAQQAKVDQAQAEQAARTAQKALENAIGSTKALNEKITALTALKAALEDNNKHLSDRNAGLEKRLEKVTEKGLEQKAENERLKADNDRLKEENKKLRDDIATCNAKITDLTNQAAQLQSQIEAKQSELETAQNDLETAKNDLETAKNGLKDAQDKRDKAVTKLQDTEKYQSGLFNEWESRQVRKYGELPAEKAKKNWKGQVIQEAMPARTIVATEDLERTIEQAKFDVMVKYNKAKVADIVNALTNDEVIQTLNAQVEQQQMEINRLNQQSRQQTLTIQNYEYFLEQKGLTAEFEQPNQTQVHTHHRRM